MIGNHRARHVTARWFMSRLPVALGLALVILVLPAMVAPVGAGAVASVQGFLVHVAATEYLGLLGLVVGTALVLGSWLSWRRRRARDPQRY